ncbi:MAG TPA: gluconate 2-dehydrogenase subunit 3 family protein [Bryobacteraceae bacterium]|nr:gluconate 2-dehydrogenase subunit 3 family protein [Bryobacteraceae bacterium]
MSRRSRRHFLNLSATTLGGLLVYTLDRRPFRVHAQAGTLKLPLRFFTEEEALTIAAAAARIFPSDASGPGANEAGVVIYIDRQLASAYGRDQYRYTQPPFEQGVPEQGWQGKETPRELYRAGLKTLGRFHLLTSAEQDAKLHQIEHTPFFSLLRTHTIEGIFCDPMHGGNRDLIGWQLIGFPGPHMSYFDDIDQHYGTPFRPKPSSLAQILGHPVRPGEDTEP